MELRTASLREHLVPAPEWFRQFRSIECTGPVEIAVAPTAGNDLNDYWMVPYPYTYPVYMRFLQFKFPDRTMVGPEELSTLTRDDANNLAMLVNERIDTFVQGMISEENLAMVDSIEDYGVIIHGTTGRIHPFVYSDLDHMTMVNMPVAGEFNIASNFGFDRIEMDDRRKKRYIEIMMNDRFMLNTWLMPIYNNDYGDRFNSTENGYVSWSMTETCHMRPEDYVSIMNYVNNCIDLRCKVVLVP